jgi:hypothetical protein
MKPQRIYRLFDSRRPISSRYRASQRRLHRLRWRGNWPVHMWILLVALIVVVLMAPRVVELHHELHHPKAHQP